LNEDSCNLLFDSSATLSLVITETGSFINDSTNKIPKIITIKIDIRYFFFINF
jgi:hypothetical protein